MLCAFCNHQIALQIKNLLLHYTGESEISSGGIKHFQPLLM